MSRIDFIYNLRRDTFDVFVLNTLSPAGYLLAPNNATRTLRKLAQSIPPTGRQFFADNGNFTLIGKIRKKFKHQGRDLWERVREIEERLRRTIRKNEMPSSLRKSYKTLAVAVQKEAEALAGSGDQMFNEQLSLNPTSLIGVEDITMASWLSLNIEPDYLQFPRRDYRKINNVVAWKAVKRVNALGNIFRAKYYPVASAVSYNTAFDAGRIFARRKIKKISMGFGAYMADDNYTDHVHLGRKRIDFPSRMPNRYLRTANVARGFWDGYLKEAGEPPEAFHFLGLGAPIMIAIVSLAAWGTHKLTFDATSPIKDAVKGGTLYVTKPAYLKVRTRKVAYRLASSKNRTWDCPCPFCTAFVAKHPFRYKIGRQWFQEHKRDKVTSKDLRPGNPLFIAFPLLSEPKGGPLRKAVDFARIGHNHWALEQITKSLRRASRTEAKLLTRVRNIVNAYDKHTNSSRFAQAVKFGLSLASRDLV